MSGRNSDTVPMAGSFDTKYLDQNTVPENKIPNPDSVMKLHTYAFLAAIAACGMASAQTTAYTTPVGYITSTIGPNASANTEGSATFVAASLVRPASFAGAATASPSGGSVITFSGGVPAGLDATSMLEISDGAQEGWWSAIVSSTATTVTILDTFPADLAANVKATVRKFTTIQDVFGDNSPGLAPYSTEAPYDEIQFLKPDIQEVGVIVYAGGWLNLLTEASAASEIIYPGTAVKVIHRANTSLSVVASGEVKTTKTQVDVYPSDNWLCQPNPTGGTLGTLNLGPQLLASDKLDMIETDGGAGQVVTTYVSSAGVMYNLLTEADATGVEVKEGAGYLVTRGEGAASIITIPAQVVAP